TIRRRAAASATARELVALGAPARGSMPGCRARCWIAAPRSRSLPASRVDAAPAAGCSPPDFVPGGRSSARPGACATSTEDLPFAQAIGERHGGDGVDDGLHHAPLGDEAVDARPLRTIAMLRR